MSTIVVILLVVVIVVYAIATYNGLVRQRNDVEEAYRQRSGRSWGR